MRRALGGIMLGALLSTAPVSAEPSIEPRGDAGALLDALRLTGSLRGGYWSSSRTLDDAEHFPVAALWLRATPRLAESASLVLEGWVRNEDLFRDQATDGLLREGYVQAGLGPLDLRLGRQIIAWGRADRINPTDNLAPRDFTLLVPEDEDQRRGVAAAQATYYLGGLALSGVWLPEFEPHTIPLRRTPGVTIRERAPREPVGQWAIKLEQTGQAVDWSLSFFDGFDLVPDFAIDQAGPSFLEILLKHNRVRVVGGDVASTLGRYGLRGEAAFTFTEDWGGDDPQVKNPFFFLVMGADRTFLERLNVNVQYLFRYVVNHRSPVEISDALRRSVATEQALVANELDQVQHGASLRVSHRWLHETLETEVAAIATFTRLDVLVRPKVAYALTDRWKAVVGADVFGGPERSFFGRLRDNTAAYIEVRWSF